MKPKVWSSCPSGYQYLYIFALVLGLLTVLQSKTNSNTKDCKSYTAKLLSQIKIFFTLTYIYVIIILEMTISPWSGRGTLQQLELGRGIPP